MFAGRKRRTDVSPADSKSRHKMLAAHQLMYDRRRTCACALCAPSSCLRYSLTCAGRTDPLPNQPLWWTCSAPYLSSYGDLAGCSFVTVIHVADVRRMSSHVCTAPAAMPPVSWFCHFFLGWSHANLSQVHRVSPCRAPSFVGMAVPSRAQDNGKAECWICSSSGRTRRPCREGASSRQRRSGLRDGKPTIKVDAS